MKLFLRLIHQLIVCTLITSAHGQSFDELQRSVEEGDVKAVAGWLDRGLDPNTTDKEGLTLLMKAANSGQTDLVKLLIERKAAVNRRAPSGDTALMYACLKGHVGAAQALIEGGAPVNLPGWTPLHYAAFGGFPELVRLILDRGGNKNAIAPNGFTPLMLAARNGHVNAARALLLSNPDVNHVTANGETALVIATTLGDGQMIDLLKRAGATR